ncbi:MAG: response regulator [Desulfobacterales bacterium]
MDKKLKLLIIDDNEEMLAALYNFFNKKNYDVVATPNSLHALKLIEAEKKGFDLVITDLVMPNISGVGVISIIKKKHPGTPVIAITGWGEHPEALAAEANADLVLEKPFRLPALDKLINDLLSSKKH